MYISAFPIVCRTGGLSTSVYFYAKRAIYMILQVGMPNSAHQREMADLSDLHTSIGLHDSAGFTCFCRLLFIRHICYTESGNQIRNTYWKRGVYEP